MFIESYSKTLTDINCLTDKKKYDKNMLGKPPCVVYSLLLAKPQNIDGGRLEY